MKIHYIKYDNQMDIAYFPETKRFFKINSQGKLLIENIDNRQKLEELNILSDDLIKYKEIISELSNKVNYLVESDFEENKTYDKFLNRLVIHISNNCNLKCIYCYADGGNYKSVSCQMTKDTLDKVIDVFYGQFDKIISIQFFGGEPLMNLELLEYACKRIRIIDSKRNYNTIFGIVINATLINSKFIELVKEYQINVTVSYDGHPLINNITRKYIDGRDTSDIIIEKTKLLKEKTGQPNTIEVTYTQYHVEYGVSIIDVVRHIQEIFPNTYVHLVPAGGNSLCEYVVKDLSIFKNSIDEIFKLADSENYNWNKIPTYSLVDRIFYAIKNKIDVKNSYICDAGLGTISVSVEGNFYPCFMFTNQDELKFGNVYENNIFNSDSFIELRNKFFNFSNKVINVECSNCFINTLCNGCLGLNSYSSGEVLKLSKDICDMFRGMTEQSIIGFTKYYDKYK